MSANTRLWRVESSCVDVRRMGNVIPCRAERHQVALPHAHTPRQNRGLIALQLRLLRPVIRKESGGCRIDAATHAGTTQKRLKYAMEKTTFAVKHRWNENELRRCGSSKRIKFAADECFRRVA